MEAIDAYYRENYNDLVKMCATKVKWEDAEDLVQTAFVLLLEKGQQEPIRPDEIDGFIKTALFTRRLNLHRAQSNEGQKVEVAEILQLAGEGDPETILLQNEAIEDLIDKIELVRQPFRDWLRLFFIEGISAAEIATAYDVSDRYVRRHVQTFREKYQKSCSDSPC